MRAAIKRAALMETCRVSDPAKAVVLILVANALYAFGYALAKVMAAELDPLQITFLRSALVVLGALPFVALAPAPSQAVGNTLVPPRAWQQRLAGALLIVSTTLGVWAYALLPVTEAAAIGFTGPLILVAAGAVILRERVSPRGWIAVGLGFAGMLVIVRPGGEVFTPAAAVPVCSALTYAMYQVMARRLRGVMDEWGSAIQSALAGIVLLGPAMVLLWRPLSWRMTVLVVVFAVVQTAGLAALAGALRRADVSRIAPWHYMRFIFSAATDVVMFGRVPPLSALAGGALIAAGGLVSLRRPTPASAPAARSRPAPATRE